ncbi:mechanosensitive channel of small conductance-like 10 [Wolffia australiana]
MEAAKGKEELVLVINGEKVKQKNSDSPRSSPSMADLPNPSQRSDKPPLPAASLLRRRSLNRSTISKPKSRFEELPPPRLPPEESIQPVAAGSPSHSSSSDEDDEETDEEIYRAERSDRVGKKRKRRCGISVPLEWLVLVAAAALLATSLSIRKLQGVGFWGLEIWKWCVMVIAVCCGRLLTGWLVLVIVFLVERNFLLKKKVLYFVYGIKNSFRICVWLALVLASWSLVFRSVRRSGSTVKILDFVSRAIVSLLVGSVIWLVKTLMVKLLAASFHVNTFFDRIQDSIFHQYVLQALSGPPAENLNNAGVAEKKSRWLRFVKAVKGKNKEKGAIDVSKLHKLSPEKVTPWTMKGLVNAVTGSGYLTLSKLIDETANEELAGGGKEITDEWEAKSAARRIFFNVAKPGARVIEEEDLLRFLTKEETELVLPQFEGVYETGKIKKSAFRNWVLKAYVDRKSLAHSLNDTKTAVKQLHKLISVIVLVIIVMISLLLMGFATTKIFVFISSQLLLVVFVFGNACKTTFESIIFVFVMHPFDVGDRCVIDGVQMIVEEMNILTTVFLRYDNEKIYYPNSVLAAKPISNFFRSPDMSDTVEFSIDFSTSLETIAALKSRIKSYIESKPQQWRSNHSLVVKEIVNVNRLNLALYVNHTMNFQNIPEKNLRRSDLVVELKTIFEDLSICYNLPPQKVHVSYPEPVAPPPPLTLGR